MKINGNDDTDQVYFIRKRECFSHLLKYSQKFTVTTAKGKCLTTFFNYPLRPFPP